MNPQPGVGTAATAAPGSLGPSPTPAPSGAAQWKAPIGLIIGIAVVVILIVLFLSFVLGGHGSSSLYAMLSSKSNQTLPKLSQIMGKQISEESQLNVSYSGNVIFNASGSGSLLDNLEATIPFRLSFEKNGNNTRSYLYAAGVPLLGNITSYSIHLVNGTDFSCGSFLTSLLGKSSAAANITCLKSSKSTVGNLTSGINSTAGGIFSNSTMLTVMGQREYNGNGCVMVGMHGSTSQNGTITKYNITMCISSQYYVPLNITGYLNEKQNQTVSFSFSMSATSIGAPVTVQGIAALPGPIENNTYGNLSSTYNSSIYNSTGLATLGTACIPVAGYLCQTPSMNSNGLLSFTLGQNTAATQYNVALACAQVSNGQGLPGANSNPWYYVTKNGTVVPTAGNQESSITLSPGEQINVTGLKCFDMEGDAFSPVSLGAAFEGTLWINYTAQSTNNPGPNALMTEMGTISIKTS